MNPHITPEIIMQYAQDAQKYPSPWKHWEFMSIAPSNTRGWQICTRHPNFGSNTCIYRRRDQNAGTY